MGAKVHVREGKNPDQLYLVGEHSIGAEAVSWGIVELIEKKM